jgi:hypothetical protein
MMAHQQTGNLEGWREASQRAIAGFERVHQATLGDPASVQDLTRSLAQACDGFFAFSSPTPADLQVALARARQLVALADTADASRLEILARFQFLTADVSGAVASLEQAIGAVPDGPDGAMQRQALSEQLEEYRKSLPSPAKNEEEQP